MFIHPVIGIITVIDLQFQAADKICDILECIMGRIFSQHQHLVIYLPNVTDTVNKFYFCAFCLHFRVKYFKEGAGCKIAHLIAVAHNIDGLSENVIPIFFISLLCQGIVAQLIRPQIQFWIAAAVEQFYGKHKQHIKREKDSPGPQPFQVQFFFYAPCQFSINVGKKE